MSLFIWFLEPEEEKIDWLGILREGEPELKPLGSESDLSDWSDQSDGELQLPETETLKAPEITEVKVEKKDHEDSKDWLRANLQFPYWNEEQRFPPSSDNFSGRTEQRLEFLGKLDVRTEKVTEYQLIREILWMLRTPTDSPVFEFRNGRFYVTELLALNSLTDAALRKLLDEVLLAFSDVYALRAFIYRVEHPVHGAAAAHTVEAYCSGLNLVLHQFSEALLSVEQTAAKQVI